MFDSKSLVIMQILRACHRLFMCIDSVYLYRMSKRKKPKTNDENEDDVKQEKKTHIAVLQSSKHILWMAIANQQVISEFGKCMRARVCVCVRATYKTSLHRNTKTQHHFYLFIFLFLFPMCYCMCVLQDEMF